MNQQFQNNTVKSWERVLSNKEDLARLFKELRLDNYHDIKIVSRTFSNEDRLIVAVDVMDIQGIKDRVIIDATSGHPTWRQFINVTYESGKFTDIKIILFASDYGFDLCHHRGGGREELNCLARHNNKCGVRTFLVKGIMFNRSNQKISTKYEIVAKPDDVKFMPEVKLPSKEEVQRAEFWLGYYGMCHDADETYWYMENDIFGDWDWGHSIGVASLVGTLVIWSDGGLFLKLIGRTGSEVIDWIWANRKFAFEVVYRHCPITHETHQHCGAISIKIGHTPLREIFGQERNEKAEYGEYICLEEQKFMELADTIVEDYENHIPISKLLGPDIYERIRVVSKVERIPVHQLIRESVQLKIDQAYKNYPYITKGKERPDTLLTKPNNIIAK